MCGRRADARLGAAGAAELEARCQGRLDSRSPSQVSIDSVATAVRTAVDDVQAGGSGRRFSAELVTVCCLCASAGCSRAGLDNELLPRAVDIFQRLGVLLMTVCVHACNVRDCAQSGS